MRFVEIERLIGAMLPAGAARAQWWANERGPHRTHVQCDAWLAASFEAFLVPGKERVRFQPVGLNKDLWAKAIRP